MSSFTDGGTLSSTNLIGLLINIDWFQPFKHISYSVGVIYAVIINLPRSMRYKDENVVIIGIIPGPHEPKTHINSYLGPFVNELQQPQYGQWFETPFGKQFIRCILMCLSSDIPATRKAAGFVGHNARKACSRCLKNFERVDDHLKDLTEVHGLKEHMQFIVRKHTKHSHHQQRLPGKKLKKSLGQGTLYYMS